LQIGSHIAISATSVDDILITTNSKTESNLATSELNQHFTLTDGGDAEWILGCAITRWRNN
jgi:hypothetical protein